MSAIGYWDCSQCGKSVSQAAGHAHPRLRREMISVQTYCAHGPGWDHARCHLITEVAAPPTGQHRDQQNERKIELTKAMTPAHCVSTGTGCPQFGCRLLQPPTNPFPIAEAVTK